MAAAESMGLTFVDEDDLPVAFLRIAYVDSDNEAPVGNVLLSSRVTIGRGELDTIVLYM